MADQQSKTDQNGRSTLLAVNSSGELRRVVVNDDGTITAGGGGGAVTMADGANVTQGTTTDAAATGDGTIVGILKRLRTLLSGGLPAALGATGGLKVEGIASAVPLLIGGPNTASTTADNVGDGTRLFTCADGSNEYFLIRANHFNGTTWDRVRTANRFVPLDAVSINAETTVWDPAAGKKFRLMGYHLSASIAGNVLLKDGNGGTTIVSVPAGAGGGGSVVSLGNGILSAAADNNLRAIGPATATLSGLLWGTEE